jgi:hypothetical protein
LIAVGSESFVEEVADKIGRRRRIELEPMDDGRKDSGWPEKYPHLTSVLEGVKIVSKAFGTPSKSCNLSACKEMLWSDPK